LDAVGYTIGGQPHAFEDVSGYQVIWEFGAAVLLEELLEQTRLHDRISARSYICPLFFRCHKFFPECGDGHAIRVDTAVS
jgi:hypothetical protein